MRSESAAVAIIGAGVCGLSAARDLSRAGVKVLVLEQEKMVGGLAKTVTREGCRVDLGSHRLHPAAFSGELGDWLGQVCPGEILVRPRRGRLLLQGKYITYPPSLFGLVGALGAGNTLRCLKGYLRQKASPESFPPPENYESYIVKKVGWEAYRFFYRPYAVKVWRVPPTEISMDEVKKRVVTSHPLQAAAEALRRLAARRSGGEPTYLYPRGGIGKLCLNLRKEVEKNGGMVKTGARVVSLAADSARRIVSITYDDGSGPVTAPAAAVAGTVNLQVLSSCLACPPPEEAAAALSRLTWRGLRLFYWQPPGLAHRECETLYFPELEFPFGRISVPRLFEPAMGAPEGKELICLELPCSEGDETWSLPDADIRDRLRPVLAAAGVVTGPGKAESLCFSERLRHVYPMLLVNWRLDFQRAYEWLRSYKNLFPIGRQGLFLHNNIDQSIVLGRNWARGFLAGGPENPAWDDQLWSWAEWKIRD